VGEVAELLERYQTSPGYHGIIFFEGMMISHMLGTVGAVQLKHDARSYLAFLDTPLDVCINRVKKRREERGDLRPFDPRNVVLDHPRVELSKKRALKLGYRVLNVRHDQAWKDVLVHLGELAHDARERTNLLDQRTLLRSGEEAGKPAEAVVS